MTYEPLFVQFLYYFNIKRDYYMCHDVMEELWLENNRNPLYQGLLQVAVGLYHFQNDNISGAIKLFKQSIAKMEKYPPFALGVNLDKLLHETALYVAQLVQFERHPFDFYDLDIEIVQLELGKAVHLLQEYQ